MSEKIKDSWAPSKFSVLHWDEKLMTCTLDNQYKKEERLPVLLSGEGQTKLLGVPKLPIHSTDTQGDLISGAVCSLLDDWPIQKCYQIYVLWHYKCQYSAPYSILYKTTNRLRSPNVVGCLSSSHWRSNLDACVGLFGYRGFKEPRDYHLSKVLINHGWSPFNTSHTSSAIHCVFFHNTLNYILLIAGLLCITLQVVVW